MYGGMDVITGAIQELFPGSIDPESRSLLDETERISASYVDFSHLATAILRQAEHIVDALVFVPL